MAATATARTSPTRRPAARAARAAADAARRRRVAADPAPRPHQPARCPRSPSGRTAIAVGGIADSGLVFRLTRGRLWIGLLAVLLVGIVGLNVMALSFSASSSNAAARGRRASSARTRRCGRRCRWRSRPTSSSRRRRSSTSSSRPPGAYRYLKADPADAEAAAKRLRDGEIAVAESAPAARRDLGRRDPVVPVDRGPPPSTAAPAVDDGDRRRSTTAAPPVETAAPRSRRPRRPTAALGGVAAP